MQKFLPTTKVGIIGNLGFKPEDVTGDYFESKLQTKNSVKPPNWDSAGESVELLAIHIDRENQEMYQIQKEMLQNQKSRDIREKFLIKEITQNQVQLKERFEGVTDFMRTCDEKKINAEKRIEVEKNVQKSIKHSITQYRNMMNELEAFRTVMKNVLKKFEPYEEVINEVVAKSDLYTSPYDCMARCDALMLGHSEIKSMQKQKLEEIEDMQKKMIQYTNEAALAVMGLKNELANLERAYNIAHSKSLKWEEMTMNAKKVLSEREFMKGQIYSVIRNTYKLLCRRREIEPAIALHGYADQLQFIKSEMEIMQSVVKQFDN